MKSRIFSNIKAILILPFTGVVIIPAVVLLLTVNWNSVWGWEYPFNTVQIVFGSLFIIIGLYLLFTTVRLFITVGKGTLAPWEPPQKLVVEGIYRYVRNPMISGVLVVLLGEAILFGSIAVFIWCVLFFVENSLYFKLVEEPGLVKRFGRDYIEYRRNVPGWLPRFTPWDKNEFK